MNNNQMALLSYTEHIGKFHCAVYNKGEFKGYSAYDDIATIAINKLLGL